MSETTTSVVEGETIPLSSPQPKSSRRLSPLRWLVSLLKWYGGMLKRHFLLTPVVTLGVLYGLFMLRTTLHPYVIFLREHTFVPLIGIPIMFFLWLLFLRPSAYRGKTKGQIAKRILVAFVVKAAVVGAMWLFLTGGQQYLALWYYYTFDLEVVELKVDQLPESRNERIQPLNSIYTIAADKIGTSDTRTRPDFVRAEEGYRFTYAIEPKYRAERYKGNITTIVSVDATSPAPDFSRNSWRTVDFETGEGLYFSKNAEVSVIKSLLNPFRFINYEPDGVQYITDDNGDWVQIVPLIKWEGILFPRPEFGGVQVIRQISDDDNPILFWLRRVFVGLGEWVPPDEVQSHPYLAGQNIQSYRVSRRMAESFRFQGGFLDPLPYDMFHKEDIRIPDMPETMNDFPYTGYFIVPHPEGGGKLYHYFPLEPYDTEKRGLNMSLWVPADGVGPDFVYKHHELTGSPTGVSALPTMLKETDKVIDWSHNVPVESRPYIRTISGEKRFLFMTTIVTVEANSPERFIAGSDPDVIFTDPFTNRHEWVKVLNPAKVPDLLAEAFQDVWGAPEAE